MGYAPQGFALDAPGITDATGLEVVKSGQVINGLCCSDVPDGVRYFVKFGNNPFSGPWEGVVTWTFGAGVPSRDVREGVFVRTNAVVPGGRITFQVSYES